MKLPLQVLKERATMLYLKLQELDLDDRLLVVSMAIYLDMYEAQDPETFADSIRCVLLELHAGTQERRREVEVCKLERWYRRPHT